MMMCTRCKKRPAVVFISQLNVKDPDSKKNQGLCLVCAKELGISQVDDYMKQMGISDDDLEAMSNQLMELSDGEDFEMGGSGTMPNFLSNLFSGDHSPLSERQNTASSSQQGTKDKDKKQKKLKFLNSYCTNLTEKAREGKLDNIVGRDKEISRVIHILSRRQKNNPCLIGEPGVGKTAVAEGIAQRIVSGDVPFHIRDKELYLLDLTALVAGTQFRGQFESRCKGLVEEVKSLGNVILFIDEVHTLVGTGDSEGTMNAANILKPSLSRGEIQVIGATTFKEYRKYIEKDSALEIYCLNQRKSVKFDKKDLPEKLEGKFLGYASDPKTNKLLTAYVIKPIPSENWKLVLRGKRGYEKSIAVLDKLCQFIFEDEKEVYYARCVKKADLSQIGKFATNFLRDKFWIASRAKGGDENGDARSRNRRSCPHDFP